MFYLNPRKFLTDPTRKNHTNSRTSFEAEELQTAHICMRKRLFEDNKTDRLKTYQEFGMK